MAAPLTSDNSVIFLSKGLTPINKSTFETINQMSFDSDSINKTRVDHSRGQKKEIKIKKQIMKVLPLSILLLKKGILKMPGQPVFQSS